VCPYAIIPKKGKGKNIKSLSPANSQDGGEEAGSHHPVSGLVVLNVTLRMVDGGVILAAHVSHEILEIAYQKRQACLGWYLADKRGILLQALG
jgi:hypothetical protein